METVKDNANGKNPRKGEADSQPQNLSSILKQLEEKDSKRGKGALSAISTILKNKEDPTNRNLADQARGAEEKCAADCKLLCEKLLEENDEVKRDKIKSALKQMGGWQAKAKNFLTLLQNGNYERIGLQGDDIVEAISLTVEAKEKNPYSLTDLLIREAAKKNRVKDLDERMIDILAALIIESTNGDQEAAGRRLNSIRTSGANGKWLESLRIKVGGETALSPIMERLTNDLDTYFREPIKNLNTTTQANWQDTIRYAQYGFVGRMVMSAIVFLVGIVLVLVSGWQFMFDQLDTSRFFGNSVSFVSGLATMLLVVYTGPLKQIRSAVNDLGIANTAFIAYVHRILQTSHTFSLYYVLDKISFEEMKKSSALISKAMDQTIDCLSKAEADKDP